MNLSFKSIFLSLLTLASWSTQCVAGAKKTETVASLEEMITVKKESEHLKDVLNALRVANEKEKPQNIKTLFESDPDLYDHFKKVGQETFEKNKINSDLNNIYTELMEATGGNEKYCKAAVSALREKAKERLMITMMLELSSKTSLHAKAMIDGFRGMGFSNTEIVMLLQEENESLEA